MNIKDEIDKFKESMKPKKPCKDFLKEDKKLLMALTAKYFQ